VLLEIGPGYGRILRSCLQSDAPFGRYIGLDLSAALDRRLGEILPEA